MDMDMRYMRMVMSICDTHIALYIVVMGTLRNPRNPRWSVVSHLLFGATQLAFLECDAQRVREVGRMIALSQDVRLTLGALAASQLKRAANDNASISPSQRKQRRANELVLKAQVASDDDDADWINEEDDVKQAILNEWLDLIGTAAPVLAPSQKSLSQPMNMSMEQSPSDHLLPRALPDQVFIVNKLGVARAKRVKAIAQKAFAGHFMQSAPVQKAWSWIRMDPIDYV